MCGIAGVLARGNSLEAGTPAALAQRMCDRMLRRGPDALGYWNDDAAGLALSHRRLAILDLDARANQPMVSADGRHVIVYNGEIYNFRELRRGLEESGYPLLTQSDTEVLLALYAREGAAMLPRLRGMFAFAIWDSATRELFVARDPYGIKPLYVATTPQAMMFASQVKALLATGLVARDPDPVGRAGFWLLGSVPEPHTWFRDIRALPAGHHATITAAGMANPVCWWDLGEAWRHASQTGASDGEIRDRVRAALRASVEAHLVSDVPVGVFLSGGIDSGSLAALMTEAGARELKGVTLAFREFEGRHEDEAPVAQRLAQRYGISHSVRVVTREEFERDLPRILDAMDQPSVDGINTWYASKAVAEAGLKVVVSGVGGDELFQGYSSFERLPWLTSSWPGFCRIPGALPLARRLSSWKARRTGNPRWELMPAFLASIEGAWMLQRGLFSPRELPDLMGAAPGKDALQGFDERALVRGMTGPLPADARLALGQIESMTYLRNQLLRDSDWASMDHSVELRTPLVDAWLLRDLQGLLPAFHRYRNKRLLAEAPAQALPEEMITRRKTGFGIPVQQWLAQMGRSDPRSGMSRGWAKQVDKHIYGPA